VSKWKAKPTGKAAHPWTPVPAKAPTALVNAQPVQTTAPAALVKAAHRQVELQTAGSKAEAKGRGKGKLVNKGKNKGKTDAELNAYYGDGVDMDPLYDDSEDARKNYERADILVDSGAGNNALPREMASATPLKPLEDGAKAQYVTASGAPVNAEGVKCCTMAFPTGDNLKMDFTVMNVRRPIAAVSRMVGKGHTVVFAPENEGGSYVCIKKSNGGYEYKRVHERNGVYVLPAWIENSGPEAAESLFREAASGGPMG